MRCEICGARATHTCSGLDVPMLGFCDAHALFHESECPHILGGSARMERLDSSAGAAEFLSERWPK